MPLEGVYAPGTSAASRRQAESFEASNGQRSATMCGMPIVLLTSVGAKSGLLRKSPLMRVEHEGVYAVVASLGGAPEHPVWYHNVVAHPHVEMQDGAHKGDYLAHEATGEERDLWWQRAVAAFPDYAAYARKTRRLIPVFVLEPFDPSA
jgi:deazaflavin-dependent oxidoreductase (nitroreductase family)